MKHILIQSTPNELAEANRCKWDFLTGGDIRVQKTLQLHYIGDDKDLLNLDFFGKSKNQLETNWYSGLWYKTLDPVNSYGYIDLAKANDEGWEVYFGEGDEVYNPKRPHELPDNYIAIAIKTLPNTNISVFSLAVLGKRKEFTTPK